MPLTADEQQRIGALIDQYGPDAFMKSYMNVHPAQSQSMKQVVDELGSAEAVKILFNYKPGIEAVKVTRREPGIASSRLPGPGADVGIGASVRSPERPVQGLGTVPSQRTAMGSGLRADTGFGGGTTERIVRDNLGVPTIRNPISIPAGAEPTVTAQPGVERAPVPEPLQIERERGTAITGLEAARIKPITGIDAIPAVQPDIDPTLDLYSFFDTVSNSAKDTGVPLALLMAMIKQESQFQPEAKSRVGARGLLQLMQSTAIDRGLRVDKEVDERLDPMKNINAGLQHMAWLKANFKPKNVQSWLAAYNAGHTRLKSEKWKKMSEPREYANRITKFAKEYEDDPSLLARDFIRLYQNIQRGKGL